MAKAKERTALKKGKASFNLIGRVRLTDKTFNLDNVYDSGWTDSSMYVGIDCGNGNLVYAEMKSGFFPDKDNIIRAYAKSDRDESTGKSKQVEIAWEDRLDEELFDTISESSFITVGVEKDIKGKTVRKKFLTAYDAVEYLNEYLEDGTVVNVKGNLVYSEYDEKVSVRKEITSIVLARVDSADDFKATFSQTILLDSKSIAKENKEKNTIELNAYVVDYVGKPKINNKKIEVKQYVSFPKQFEIEINENRDITTKMLAKFFKAKKGKLIEITVTGNIIEGGSIVNITEDDLSDDIKELVEMGVYDLDEAIKKCSAVGNNDREKRMVISKPDIVYIGSGDDRKPTIAFDDGKYTDDDLYFYEQALADSGYGDDDNDVDDSADSSDVESDEDDDLLSLLENI